MMSQAYANSSAASEYFYLDTGDTTVKVVGDANCNKRFTIRSALALAGKIQYSIIPLNKFSLFEGLGRNLFSAKSNSDKPQVNILCRTNIQ